MNGNHFRPDKPKCPYCGAGLTYLGGEYYCANPNCKITIPAAATATPYGLTVEPKNNGTKGR